MDNLTDLEKLLYNKHLATSRVCANKPFKIKKNFSDIVNTDKHKHLKRLAILFTKHPDIDFNTFFEAPYKLYSDVSYFGLDYFASMRAVKAYTTYKKMLFLQDPDNQVSSVESSLRFIAKYCIEKRIYLHQYPYQKTADLYVWMKHYKENKINIYSVFEFSNIYSLIKELADDVQKFFISDFVEQFQILRTKYNNSKKLKTYLKKAIPVLNNFVEQQLTSAKTSV